jgi:hypothetical protein
MDGRVRSLQAVQHTVATGALPKPGRSEDRVAERPTVRPPFDPETFARESESGLHETAAPTAPPPTPRVLQRPEAPLLELTPSSRGRSPSAPDTDSPDIEEPTAGDDALSALGRYTVPVLGVSRDELQWVVLSADADRLLGCVDGTRTLEKVAMLARMSPEDVAAVLLDLADQGVVSFL